MITFSLGHLIALAIALVPLWVFSRVIAKAGFSPWWALLGLVPVANIVALWVLAYVKWPALPEG